VEVRDSEVDDTDQASLFADTTDDQQTLTDKDANAQFLFDAPGESND
jgi:hypothetical protein